MGEQEVDMVLVHDAPNVVQPTDKAMDDLSQELVPVAPLLDEGDFRVTAKFFKQMSDLLPFDSEIELWNLRVLLLKTRRGRKYWRT